MKILAASKAIINLAIGAQNAVLCCASNSDMHDSGAENFLGSDFSCEKCKIDSYFPNFGSGWESAFIRIARSPLSTHHRELFVVVSIRAFGIVPRIRSHFCVSAQRRWISRSIQSSMVSGQRQSPFMRSHTDRWGVYIAAVSNHPVARRRA